MNENNFDSILSSIMSNNDLMNKISDIVKSNKNGSSTDALPDVIAALSPIINSNPKTEEKEDIKGTKGTDTIIENLSRESNDTNSKEVLTKGNGDSKNILGSLSESISKNSKLLLALKPYLSKERSEMIDNIVRVSQIADIIKLTK